MSRGRDKALAGKRTSNDCAYQSCTLLMEGISFKPSGRSPSSCTRCARRMGSSSARNCEARKRVPVTHTLKSAMKCIDGQEGNHTGRGALSKLHHLPQTHAGGREARVVLDGVHQLVRLPPRHDCWCADPPRGLSSLIDTCKRSHEGRSMCLWGARQKSSSECDVLSAREVVNAVVVVLSCGLLLDDAGEQNAEVG